MIRLVLALLLLVPAMTHGAPAAQQQLKARPYGANTGLGLAIGTGMSGISLYRDLTPDTFVQGVFAIGAFGSVGLSGDYEVVIPQILKETKLLRAYYGGGFVLFKFPRSWYYPYDDRFQDRYFIGAHMPLGVQFLIPNTPLQLAFQLEPGVWVAPGTYVFLEATLTFRFLF